jgi:hypothetical protein
MSEPVLIFYSYVCQRCAKPYLVNEPNSWRLCTPEFCHDCYEHLSKQWALVNDDTAH